MSFARSAAARAPDLLALLALMLVTARPAAAQLPGVRGYALNVGGYVDASTLAGGGFFDVQRLRFMSRPTLGPISVDIAYEHMLEYRGGGSVQALAGTGGAVGWIRLESTLRERDRFRWRHQFDRLSVAVPVPGTSGAASIRAGRQTISWASTLLLTPADPFSPFDPADPFREFRGGVDAVRLQIHPGPFTEIDAVVRPLRLVAGGTYTTALGRWKGLLRRWETSGWAGVLHDEAAAGAGAVGSAGPVSMRAEASLRRASGSWTGRAAAGVDGRRDLADRDLFLAAELRYDGLGARDADALPAVLASDFYRRGELQLLGRWAAAGSATLQVHPLVSVNLLVLTSLSDGSALAGPGMDVSLTDEIALRVGGYMGHGRDAARLPGGGVLPRSEFGLAPRVVYAALSAYF